MSSEFDLVPDVVLTLSQILVGLGMVLSCWRIWRGPSIFDRIIALDLLGSQLMAQFILLVFQSGFVHYLDVAASIALVSFLATVAFARYLERDYQEDES